MFPVELILQKRAADVVDVPKKVLVGTKVWARTGQSWQIRQLW